MEITGLDHVSICVSDFRKSEPFYDAVMRAFGFKKGDKAIAGSPQYNDDYYATFFEAPDGTRLEVVARSRHRQEIVARWEDLAVFTNPIAELRSRESRRS